MKYIEGDLILLAKNGKFDLIVHGCNCFNTMGAGIAKMIKDNFIGAWKADQKTKKGDRSKLGNYTSYIKSQNDNTLRIINAYTQYTYGGKSPVDYDAIRECFKKINSRYKGKKVGIPKIGAGLAGGNWKQIEKIIDEETKDLKLTCVIYNKKISI
tara:strand:+ start:3841 stop:4305 length:465 start_codon:yes stop_codon:yes gene_type:complete